MMQASRKSTPTAGDCGTIFVAIELSQKTWLITVHSPDRDQFSRHRLEGGDHAGLLALIEKVRARATQQLGSTPRVVSCYEAGYDGFWLHRLLEAAGISSLVFDAASIAVEQRSRRAKTDRIDGELLLRTLMAHLRGEPRVVRIVRVPSVEEEDARRASRERDRLITEQTAHTNRIKSLLRLLGMAVGNPRRRDWLAWLKRQRDWQGRPLPPHLLAEAQREHARLMLVREQLAALEQVQAAQASAVPAPMAERRDLLQRLKALGPAFTATLVNELFYKDFRNRREVASYLRIGAQSLAEWRHRPRAGHQQGRQSACSPQGNRTGLALAPPSAEQRPQPLVPHPYGQCWQARQAHRHRRAGAQADCGAVALSHRRARS